MLTVKDRLGLMLPDMPALLDALPHSGFTVTLRVPVDAHRVIIELALDDAPDVAASAPGSFPEVRGGPPFD